MGKTAQNIRVKQQNITEYLALFVFVMTMCKRAPSTVFCLTGALNLPAFVE